MKELTREEMGTGFLINQQDEMSKVETPVAGKATPIPMEEAPKPTFMKAHPWKPKGRK